ncbi:MAG: ATP-binding protein [Geobacteraceae bacterium]|nr:ATP-binding protein [Geobacteraceae bacterium]
MKNARFHVDSRLPTLLSQEYTSTERAIKELVDNAWDADATSVRISLPKPMTSYPIVVVDDGSGMTEEELRRHYLSIATDRRAQRGELTARNKRRVKGRKGIGKFAGLMAAAQMRVESAARGKRCSFTLSLEDLSTVKDIEKLDLPLQVVECTLQDVGTCVTLDRLHQGLSFPDPNKLRQVLLQEYGREEGFAIFVDDKLLDVDDIRGLFKENKEQISGVGPVTLRFSISDQKTALRAPGIVIRVDGKIVGKPSFFGLDKSEDFPPKLLKKLFGEVEADGLFPHVTAGWDSLIENSELLLDLEKHVQPILREAFKEQYGREMQLAQARLQRKIQDRLAALPEYKRAYADRAIRRILDRYYDEPESKVEPLIFVLLEALERSDYRTLLEHIADAPRRDIVSLADSLSDFSLADMAFLGEQARARIVFLNDLERLCRDEDALEAPIHKSIENALWILGPEYSLFSSNQTLKRQIEDYLGKTFVGDRANNRPDLLLNEDLNGRLLLIEFKRPKHPLALTDYHQATTYRHEFSRYTDQEIQVVLLGGKMTDDLPKPHLREPNVKIMLFQQVISSARRQLDWLLKQLTASTSDSHS